MSKVIICVTLFCLLSASMAVSGKESEAGAPESDFQSIFDGKVLAGWTGNPQMFRIEDESIVGGSMKKKIPNNEFITFKQEFADFELRLEAKLIGDGGNAGIQIRSRRPTDKEIASTEKGIHIPKHEMIGYQVDMGKAWDKVWWGKLYDESRRRKVIAAPADEAILEKLVKWNKWNEYRILCEGPHIQVWLNGTKTVDYTEKENKIANMGIIGLQIHGGPPSEAWYRNIRIREITAD